MAQQARVPKFGNWESDGNTPYTQYFDNARKDRVIGGRTVNPNDPQEMNPEEALIHNLNSKGAAARAPASPLRHDPLRVSEPHGGGRPHRVSAGSDRSLEQSPLHPNYQMPKAAGARNNIGANSPSPLWERERDRERRRDSLEGQGLGLAPNTPERSRMRHATTTVTRGDHEILKGDEKGPSVPKFGEWDENDPASADEFTHIFDKVREDKQVGSSRVPSMQADDSSSHHNAAHRSSARQHSACCGCFSWLKN